MITQLRYDELLPRYTEFTAAVAAYGALLTAHELPFSIDANGLLFAYKTQLFTKLVAVNKGLKMQYDMLKSDEVKQALINNTIDLSGYEVVNDIATGLQELHDTLTVANHALRGADKIEKPTLADLVGFELSIAAYLKAHVIEWTADRAAVLHQVTEYANMVTSLESMLRGYGTKADAVGEFHRRLADLVSLTNGVATVNELAVFNMIVGAAHRAKAAELKARKEAAVRELNRAQDEARQAAAHKRAQETEAFLRARNNQ
jgi:hypothetical protein